MSEHDWSSEVLAAMQKPVIGHRGPEIKALMAELRDGLRDVFQTRRPVMISTSSATGFMEAGIRNAARARVLSLVNGAFSQRFAEIGTACGFEVDVLEVDDLDDMHERLTRLGIDVTPLETQRWGLRDFRLLDPDGYYLRLTTPPPESASTP